MKRKVFELVVVDREADKVVETVRVTGDTENDATARAGAEMETDLTDRKYTVLAVEIGSYEPLEVQLVKNR